MLPITKEMMIFFLQRVYCESPSDALIRSHIIDLIETHAKDTTVSLNDDNGD